jgi:hypothetical protein
MYKLDNKLTKLIKYSIFTLVTFSILNHVPHCNIPLNDIILVSMIIAIVYAIIDLMFPCIADLAN